MNNWRNIEVDDFYVTYNKYHNPILPFCNWCGRNAVKTVTRTSSFSDNTYTDFACESHANEWETGINKR